MQIWINYAIRINCVVRSPASAKIRVNIILLGVGQLYFLPL